MIGFILGILATAFFMFSVAFYCLRGRPMTHKFFYETDKQFQQEALIFVALSLNESACVLISDGNIAEAEEIALIELINISKQKSFDKPTINTIALYLNLVQEENNHMRQAFTKHR